MRHTWRIVVAMLASLAPVSVRAAEPLQRTILVFDQSDPNSPWGNGFRTGLRSALNTNSIAPVSLYSDILDLARFDTKEYEEILGTYLRTKYRNKEIGAVVVHGPRALEIFLKLRTNLWPTVPVVFAAISEATIARLKPP